MFRSRSRVDALGASSISNERSAKPNGVGFVPLASPLSTERAINSDQAKSGRKECWHLRGGGLCEFFPARREIVPSESEWQRGGQPPTQASRLLTANEYDD